jgi:hypothetical protein
VTVPSQAILLLQPERPYVWQQYTRLESSLLKGGRSAGTRRSTQKGYTLYPARRFYWIIAPSTGLLPVIESRNTVSIHSRRNTATNWEILPNTLLAGELSVGQQATYHAVCSYLQLAEQDAPKLLSTWVALEDIRRRSGHPPLSNEQVREPRRLSR